MWQFAESIRGIADACRALGTPVTGGNVSFYNESGDSAIWPTPVVGMLGLLDDYRLRGGRGVPAAGPVRLPAGRDAGRARRERVRRGRPGHGRGTPAVARPRREARAAPAAGPRPPRADLLASRARLLRTAGSPSRSPNRAIAGGVGVRRDAARRTCRRTWRCSPSPRRAPWSSARGRTGDRVRGRWPPRTGCRSPGWARPAARGSVFDGLFEVTGRRGAVVYEDAIPRLMADASQ